ncbi:PilZ domain-containing protein [Thiomicrorhabdus sp.]|uniref:PilZ domain-containing protein n=1 Tax=Thiomicrorhabdus sp. TaxID=2039724 RepID=UPI003562E53A
MSQPVEKRFAKRIPSNRPVLLISGNQNIYATMTDFSMHGVGLISDIALQVNDRIEIHFDIPEADKPRSFQFKAQVRHCIPLQFNAHIGVKLDFPTQAYLALYEKLSAA